MKFRPLKADEVECRIAQVYEGKGVTLLLYKNARCDMNILDETVGAENWQDKFYECDDKLFCSVGIKCGNDWIWKSDCGIESKQKDGNEQKAQASDSRKRAGFVWGIGRELYTAPLIYIPANDKSGDANYRLDDKGKPRGSFFVSYLKIREGRITGLVIENRSPRRTVFQWGEVDFK